MSVLLFDRHCLNLAMAFSYGSAVVLVSKYTEFLVSRTSLHSNPTGCRADSRKHVTAQGWLFNGRRAPFTLHLYEGGSSNYRTPPLLVAVFGESEWSHLIDGKTSRSW